MKQALVVRTDLGMSRGKVAAQAAHASLRAYNDAGDEARRDWERTGAKKVVLAVPDEATLLDRADAAGRAGLPYAVVRDAGHTELDPGTVTALGVGPAGDDAVDRVTGSLSLY